MNKVTCLLALIINANIFSCALAQECTSVPSAVLSHFVTHNTEYGGHVLTHILGQIPPISQKNKTLFGDDNQYEAAWAILSQNSPICPTTSEVGKEAARDIAFVPTRQSEQCTSAAANGSCNGMYGVNTYYVTFIFRTVVSGRGTKWIVFTAYPRR